MIDFLDANQNYHEENFKEEDEEMKEVDPPADLTNTVIKQMYYDFLSKRQPSEKLLNDFLYHV